jgi:hypothetical protein
MLPTYSAPGKVRSGFPIRRTIKQKLQCVRKSAQRFSDKTHDKAETTVRPEKCAAAFR